MRLDIESIGGSGQVGVAINEEGDYIIAGTLRTYTGRGTVVSELNDLRLGGTGGVDVAFAP